MNLNERTGLALANEVYACSSGARIKRHRVACPEISEFSQALRKFELELGEEAKDEYWESLLLRLRRYRFLLSTLPLPFNHPALYQQGTLESIEKQVADCDQVYPDMANGARDLLQRFATIASQEKNYLLMKMLELSSPSWQSSTALVLKETRFIDPVEDVLSSELMLRQVRVVGTQHLRGGTCYQNLIVLGAARWYPEHVFSAPRAHEIQLIGYNWFRDDWKPEPAFAGTDDAIKKAVVFPRVTNDESGGETSTSTTDYPSAEELLPGIDLDQFSMQFSRRESDPELEEIEARLLLLESGSAVFVDAAENTKTLVIDLEGSEDEQETGQRTSRVKRIPVSSIEPGMFILLRTSGGGDYVAPLANKILGDQMPQVRASQEHWKGLLREKVRESNTFEISLALLDQGSDRAEETNLRNWMSSRTIKPHDKNDFAAIMKVIGLEDKTGEYWRNAKALHSAHMRAGFHIRKLLLKKVANADLDELERTGKMDFELHGSGAGSLTAYRIIALSQKNYVIPVSHVGRPFESDAGLWQG